MQNGNITGRLSLLGLDRMQNALSAANEAVATAGEAMALAESVTEAEEERVSAETERAKAEAERGGAEKRRAAAEEKRASAEEKRAEAEEKRAEAEAARQASLYAASPTIVNCVRGETVTVHDSAERPAVALRVFGKSAQDGTPAPDSPAPIQSVKAGTRIVIGESEFVLPCDLYEGDTWYPLNGRVERMSDVLILDGKGLTVTSYRYNGLNGVTIASPLSDDFDRQDGFCTHESRIGSFYASNGSYMWLGAGYSRNIHWIGILDRLGLSTVGEFEAWLRENPVTVVYRRGTPTAEMYDPQPAFNTSYGTTVITQTPVQLSPEIELHYVADTKLYIDRKFEELNGI